METIDRLCSVLSRHDKFGEKIDVRWHAGEPLTMPLTFYQQAIPLINRALPNNIAVSHSMQTNAIGINDDWCDFFKTFDIRLGVSIDGPQFIHDQCRRTKKDRGTFNACFRGIQALRKHRIPFETISVITSFSLDYATEIHEFLCDIRPTQIGFNVEETEGINTSVSFQKKYFQERYHDFLSTIKHRSNETTPPVRELQDMANAIAMSANDRVNLMASPLAIIVMDHEGNLSTFSPELVSFKKYQFANVSKISRLTDMLDQASFRLVEKEIVKGVQSCRQLCPYFSVCGGGAPSNKLWENKTFNSTSTQYCEARIKIPTNITLEALEKMSA